MVLAHREMLDTNEIRLMRDLLPPAVAPRMDAIVEKLNRKKRRLWDASGRGAQTAHDLINSLYGATFDGRAVYSALDPYLFSFSTHAEDTSFDREHGIRSQWDSYAGPGGYCLVFDIGEVARMLGREGNARYWAWLMLEPVRYADRPVEEEYPDQFDTTAPLPEIKVRADTGKRYVVLFDGLGVAVAGQARHRRTRRQAGRTRGASAVDARRCPGHDLALLED